MNTSQVSSALFYLWKTSLLNATQSRLKRLRQPKYLLGAVVGAAYLYFAFFRRRMSRGGLPNLSTGDLEAFVSFGALAALILFALRWLWSRDRAALNFTEAEIAFLFPAPIRRRTLIHYRLIRSQAAILFTAVILAMFSRGWAFFPGDAPIRIAGWWLILATSSLHTIGSAFVITRWLDRGVSQAKRQLMMTALFAVVIGIAFAAAWPKLHAPDTNDVENVSTFLTYLSKQLSLGPLAWLLWPAKLAIGPLFAADAQSLLIALGPALLVYAAHYFWVLQAEVSFEEASITKAAKRAAKLAAFREGKSGIPAAKVRRAPFNLAAVQRPEIAFLWKNLLSSAEYLRLRTALVTAAIIVAGCTWLRSQPGPGYEAIRSSVALFAMVIAGYLVVFGPQIARQDLRRDLLNIDILKTYPLRGWQIVLGEILTPVAIVTVLLWLTLLAAALTFEPPERMAWLTPQVRTPIALGLALIMPLLCTLQLLVVNAAALLFPAWTQTGRSRAPPSIETMGQAIFFLAGQLIVMVITLIPAAIAASAIYAAAHWMVGDVAAILLATAGAFAVLGAEICFGLALLGARFERFDLSAELRV